MSGIASLVVIAAAVYAVVRRAEVRLTLLLAALALGALGAKGPAKGVAAVVQAFLATFTREQYLVPLGCSMGFAYVLRHTQCDRHLVHLLIKPLRRARPLLVPGTVLVGALVNIPIISQASTAVTIGAVLLPLLRAGRVSPVTSGAALLLGSSIGGDQLNPGAPEINTLRTGSPGHPPATACVAQVFPLFVVDLAVATAVFWVLSFRAEALHRRDPKAAAPDGEGEALPPSFRVNLFKALIPLVPLALLFLTALPPPFRVVTVPRGWLVDEGVLRTHPGEETEAALRVSFDSRLIGAAMLVGTVLAAQSDRRRAGDTAKVFFEGAGYVFAHIISLIVAAVCFGEAVKASGLAAQFSRLIGGLPGLLLPSAALLPLAFAWVCGSGMASAQSLYGSFVEPAVRIGVNPLGVGAVVCLAAAAGRTMSPVAAVVLLCASMTETDPVDLARRVGLPLVAGTAAMVLLRVLLTVLG
jgi:DcuC family C4-dicarboxylate transporter